MSLYVTCEVWMDRMNLNEPFDTLDHNKTVRSDIYQIIYGAAATIYTKVQKNTKKYYVDYKNVVNKSCEEEIAFKKIALSESNIVDE